MKKTMAILLLMGSIAGFSAAQDLNGFASDFEAMLINVTRSVSPSLQMNALSGDIIGDASISRVVLALPALGVSVSDGIAPIMKPGAYEWSLVSFPELIDSKLSSDKLMLDIIRMAETRLVPYPAIKAGIGFGLPKYWSVIVTGMALPNTFSETIAGMAGDTIKQMELTAGLFNLGFEARKTLLQDSRTTPALSAGLMYYYGGFNMNIDNLSLSALMDGGIEIPGGTIDMNGKLGFSTAVHNIGFNVHVSKHLLFFTPYAKFSGIWQHSTTEGDIDVNVFSGTALNVPIQASPEVVFSDFSSILTTGFELNLFALVFNMNAAIDLARFGLDLANFDLSKMYGSGCAINTGFRIQF